MQKLNTKKFTTSKHFGTPNLFGANRSKYLNLLKSLQISLFRSNLCQSNNSNKFPDGYIIELTKEEKQEVIKKFDHLSKLKYSPHLPKVFTEKGLYMIATIIKSDVATDTTLNIIETFEKVKELSRNINSIMKTSNETKQQKLANKSNQILEDIIDIEPDVLEDDEDGEIIETTTKFEFNLGFAKVSRSVKKVKK